MNWPMLYWLLPSMERIAHMWVNVYVEISKFPCRRIFLWMDWKNNLAIHLQTRWQATGAPHMILVDRAGGQVTVVS